MAQRFLKHGRRNSRVRRNEHQHGSHVGMDHAAAFGNAAQPAGLAVNFKFHRNFFHHRVSGHNGFGRFFIAVLRQSFCQTIHAVGNRRNIQFLSDDAGGSNHHIFGFDSQFFRSQRAHLFRNLNPVAVAGIGVAAVADHCLGDAVGNVLFRHGKGRAFHKVRRINRRRMGRHFTEDQRQVVFIVPFPDAAVDPVCSKSFCSAHAAFYLFHHLFLHSQLQPCRFRQSQHKIHILYRSAGRAFA